MEATCLTEQERLTVSPYIKEYSREGPTPGSGEEGGGSGVKKQDELKEQVRMVHQKQSVCECLSPHV